MVAPAIPEAMLDGIAAAPDDAGAWQVLSDWMLEVDHPMASYVRAELELFRGVSNPEYLDDYAEARQATSRRVRELGFGLTWRCGLVVRAVVRPDHFREVVPAPELAALHALRLKLGEYAVQSSWAPDVRLVLARVSPRLRTLSLEVDTRHLTPKTVTDLVDACRARPARGERLRLCLGRDAAKPVLDGLPALAEAGWRRVSLEGTRVPGVLAAWLGPLLDKLPREFRLVVSGTGLSPDDLQHPALEWLAPDAPAWWEQVDSHATIPVRADGILDADWYPASLRQVSLAAGCWLHAERTELDEGTVVQADGRAWRFRLSETPRETGSAGP